MSNTDDKGITDKGIDQKETYLEDKGKKDKGYEIKRRLTLVEQMIDSLPKNTEKVIRDQVFPLLKDVGEGYVDELVDLVPYSKLVTFTGKIANAFGEGIRKGIMNARTELRWDERIGNINPHNGLTKMEYQELLRVRTWLAENTRHFNDVIVEGIKNVFKFLIDEAIQSAVDEVLGRVFGKHIEKISRRIGDVVGDFFTGDYIKLINFVSQVTEDKIEETVSFHMELLFSSFLSAIMDRVIAAGDPNLEAEVAQALESEDIPEALRGVNAPSLEEVLTEMKFRIKLNALIDRLHYEYVRTEILEHEAQEELREEIRRKYPDSVIIHFTVFEEYNEGLVKIYKKYEKQKNQIYRTFRNKRKELMEEYGVQ